MTLDRVCQILGEDDGALPDITFDYGESRVVDAAYRLILDRATTISEGAYYWSRRRNEECVIRFDDEPALPLLDNDAEPFHVVFGGLRSSAGALIPDLGVFVLAPCEIALDYRMGHEWDEGAILGLFELMRDLHRLATPVQISHEHNIFDPDGDILLGAFREWMADQAPSRSVPYELSTVHTQRRSASRRNT